MRIQHAVELSSSAGEVEAACCGAERLVEVVKAVSLAVGGVRAEHELERVTWEEQRRQGEVCARKMRESVSRACVGICGGVVGAMSLSLKVAESLQGLEEEGTLVQQLRAEVAALEASKQAADLKVVSQRRKAAQVMEDLRSDLVEANSKQKQAAASLHAQQRRHPALDRRGRGRPVCRGPGRLSPSSSSSSPSSSRSPMTKGGSRERGGAGTADLEEVEKESLLQQLRQSRLLLADSERLLEHVSRKRDLAVRRQRAAGEQHRAFVRSLLEGVEVILRRHGLITDSPDQTVDALMGQLDFPGEHSSSRGKPDARDARRARGHPEECSEDDSAPRRRSQKSHHEIAAVLTGAFSWVDGGAGVESGGAALGDEELTRL